MGCMLDAFLCRTWRVEALSASVRWKWSSTPGGKTMDMFYHGKPRFPLFLGVINYMLGV